MLKLEQIEFNEEMILKGGKFILVEVIPIYSSEGDRKEDKNRTGTKIVVALTAHRLEKIEVMVDEVIATSPFNHLDLAEVSFSEFKGIFSLCEGEDEYKFQAKASQLRLVRSN